MNGQTRRVSVTVTGICGIIVICAAGIFLWVSFRAPQSSAALKQFTVPLNATSSVGLQLEQRGFVTHAWTVDIALALSGTQTHPGGYMISPSMNAWQIARVFSQKPALVWVVIPPGLRKEEIAAILEQVLGWTDAQTQTWITKDTTTNPDYVEGVYFPDTYLIPATEAPPEVAQRLQAHFEEVFAPYAAQALAQNEKWTTVLKIASLLQREAAGPQDMPLIAGIIWNRLLLHMPLDIDATLQYVAGNAQNGWWPKVSVADKAIDSTYNTYLYAGLPPTPIDNPGLPAIEAAVNPATTTCLYYLHDSSGIIHCSPTYEGQLQNIQTYLK